jgi:hypothetical protein
MKQVTILKSVGFLSIVVLLACVSQVWAEEPAKKDITGDWHVKADFNGRQMESIMTLSRDAEGKLSGIWVSFWGYTKLDDLKYEDGKISFNRTFGFGDRQFTSSFTGTIKDGKLTGTTSSERGDYAVEGTQSKACPAVGNWEFKSTRGDREFTSTLVVKADKEGKLSGEWKRPQRQRPREEGQQEPDQQRQRRFGPTVIKDMAFKDGKLTFTRVRGSEDRQRESKYELTLKGDTLSGKTESSRGTTEIQAKRADPAVVGKWELTITSERREFKQILVVNPDLSAWYGPTAVEKIETEDNKVNFKVAFGSGERSFESEFKGQLDGEKLTGEMTGFRDTIQKVTGKKIVQ